uniref:Diuretic peptide n=1 Tax=Timema monikensis TaxID=170555 RepID=A0A7R9E2G3_9NEOP|nr:unnamed protein product [Timema monikensis]
MSLSALLSTLLLVAAVCSSADSAPNYFDSPSLEALADVVPPPNQEMSLLLPQLSAKYLSHGPTWENVPDPRFYVLSELEREAGVQYRLSRHNPSCSKLCSKAARRVKRTGGPSLSIVNPLDVLRQRLLLEIARRRMRQSEDQILANRELLRSIGKRNANQSQLLDDNEQNVEGSLEGLEERSADRNR